MHSHKVKTLFMQLVFIAGTATICHAQALVCPGFETCASQSTLPNSTGNWAGDVNEVTATAQGIVPAAGTQMLRFIYTSESSAQPCPSCGGTGCDVWQLVDLSPLSALVATGAINARASAQFNRVSGDAQTDTAFNIALRSYSGIPAGFPSNYLNFLANAATTLNTDGIPETWELATVSASIPSAATFVAFLMSAVENVHNDTGPGATEFDGHFADKASLTFFCTIHSGDMNHDQSLDARDIQQFTRAIVTHSTELRDTCPGDFDDSGIVDLGDLADFVNLLIE